MNSVSTDMKLRRGWYHGWNIVAVSMLSAATANGLTYNCYSLFLRDWSAELHTPVSRLQLALPIMLLMSSAISPLIGTFSDKYRARSLFAIGLAGIALFYLVISFVTAVWQILALFGLMVPFALGLSTSIPANAVISRWFVRRLGLALGLSAFGIGAAGVLFPPIISALLPTVGWRGIWRGAAAFAGLVVLPLVVWVISDRPTERHGLDYVSDTLRAAGASHAHSAQGSDMSWRAVARHKNFWLLVFVYLSMMLLSAGCGQNAGPYAAAHGLPQKYAGILISVLSISHVAATLVVGLLSDRFGNRLPLAGLAAVNVVGAALLAVGASMPTIVLGYGLLGTGGGVFTLLAAALAVEFGAAGIGRAFGFSMLFVPIGGLSPFIIAKTQELTGSYAPAIAGFGGLVMIAGMLSLLLRERRDAVP